MMVRPASRMLSAISFGVFCRSAPSTSLIMRSRKVDPWAAVMRTLIWSDSTRGPPVARGWVDGGGPLDDLAGGGDQVPRLDDHDVAEPQLRGGDLLPLGAL